MWWKLLGLLVLTATLVLAVIPIRTRAVAYDLINEPPPQRPSFGKLLSAMYLTPGTVLRILFILAAASFVAFKVVRSHW
jgi:hypothetical protein